VISCVCVCLWLFVEFESSFIFLYFNGTFNFYYVFLATDAEIIRCVHILHYYVSSKVFIFIDKGFLTFAKLSFTYNIIIIIIIILYYKGYLLYLLL